jgi:Ca-activated chloride channel family protein
MAEPFVCQGRSSDSTTSRSWPRVAVGTAVCVVAAAMAVLAAHPPQFASGVSLVEVYAAVVDREGRPVTNLTKDDFTVLEDGRVQSVSAFASGDFPLSVAVAIDRSFSMAPRQLPIARDAARAFLEGLRPGDQAMIVAIGSEVQIVAPLSTDRRGQADAVQRLQPWGTTGLHDAIIASIDAIQSAKGRRALVLLSDGSDRYSHASAAEARDRARRSDVMVYPVAFGKTRPPLFAELATLTGGRSFQPKDAPEAMTIMATIAEELRQQYLLGYVPSKPITPGEDQWRAITVRVKRPDVTVRARDGYVAR